MPASFQIPLDIPDIEIIAVREGEQNAFILEVKSTLDYTHCRQCQRKITAIQSHPNQVRRFFILAQLSHSLSLGQ